MLFDPARHEPLCDTAWDEALACQAIATIVDDLERQRLSDGSWPMHPRDDEGDWPPGGFKSLYLGSAGVLWALGLLQDQGLVRLGLDPAAEIAKVHASYGADPDGGAVQPSYHLGEAGILLLSWQMTRDAAAADRLHAVVAANLAHPSNEALWGTPGTQLAAWHLWAATGDSRWRDLFQRSADAVWSTWTFDAAAGCHLWTQDLGDHQAVQYLGAGHGVAGNLHPLLKGAALLDDERRATLVERCRGVLQAFATRDGDAVNWRSGTFTPRQGTAMLMQWCHGAPGIVTALADLPPGQASDIDALLVAAGHAIWRAGPLAKGPGLCHGTAGNGEALLTLFQRTGDALWLQRARRFAMHAVAQADAARRLQGHGRHTLWTGDAGLAVYLWQCITGRAGMPALDLLL
jgi:hypothetical protein